jgi:hypothetical protein
LLEPHLLGEHRRHLRGGGRDPAVGGGTGSRHEGRVGGGASHRRI